MLTSSFPTSLYRYMSLSLALRYVLESLKKPPTTKMYLFGLSALDKFKTRLKDFSQYCASIASIPHFQQFPMHLKQVWPPGLHDVMMTSQANLCDVVMTSQANLFDVMMTSQGSLYCTLEGYRKFCILGTVTVFLNQLYLS